MAQRSSEFIASLVSQLQAGKLSKQDLFTQLATYSATTDDENTRSNGAAPLQAQPSSPLSATAPGTTTPGAPTDRTPMSSRDQAAAAAAAALKAAAMPRRNGVEDER